MYLESVDPNSFTQEAFDAAAESSKKVDGLDDEARLQLYGLYKQTTVGDVNTSRPWPIDMVGRAKWDAWKAFEGMPKFNAGLAYIYIVENFLPDRLLNGDASGPSTMDLFSGMGVTTSTIKEASGKDSRPWTENESIFEVITSEPFDLSKLQNMVQNCTGVGNDGTNTTATVIASRGDDGMTPLHYAVDRGLIEACEILLDAGAPINAQDNDLQTPLMFAVTCEHEAIVSILMKYGADVNIRDGDGHTVLEQDGIPEAISSLLMS